MNSAEKLPARPGVIDRTGTLLLLMMPLVALANLLTITKVGGLSVRPTDLLLVCAWILWGLKTVSTLRLHRRLLPYFVTIGGLVCVTLLGVLLFDNSVDWPRYFRFLETISWGALAFTFIRTPGQFDRYLNIIVALTAIVAGVSIGLYLIDPRLHRIAGYFSYAGGEGLDRQASYNEWGALYALSLAILLWRLHQRILSRTQLFPLGIILAGFLLVQSRSAFLAVTLVIVTLLTLNATRSYLKRLDSRFTTVVLGLLLPIAFLLIGSQWLAVNRLVDSFVPGSSAARSMEVRFDVWERSLELWQAGLFTFLIGYGSRSFTDLIDGPTADSFYLDHGLSEGLLGLLLILALLVTPSLRLYGTSDPRASLGALVLIVALTVSLTGNVLVDPIYGGVTFSLLYGLLSVHDRQRRTLAQR